jgi:hypothetical protein
MKNTIKVLLVVLVVLLIARFYGNNLDENNTINELSSENVSLNDEKHITPVEETQEEKVVYFDDMIKLTYLGVDDPNTGLTMFFIQFRLENKYDKNVFVISNEEYVNDTAVSFIGGNVSFEGIKPGKKAVCNFGFGYDGMGITNVDEIYKVEFKLKLVNPDDFSEVYLETDTITINVE